MKTSQVGLACKGASKRRLICSDVPPLTLLLYPVDAEISHFFVRSEHAEMAGIIFSRLLLVILIRLQPTSFSYLLLIVVIALTLTTQADKRRD